MTDEKRVVEQAPNQTTGSVEPSLGDAWFWWVVRFGGLAVVAYEVIERGGRPWVLLTAWGMLLGLDGIRQLVRGFVGLRQGGSQ